MSIDSCVVTDIKFSVILVFTKEHLIFAGSGSKQVFIDFSLIFNNFTN